MQFKVSWRNCCYQSLLLNKNILMLTLFYPYSKGTSWLVSLKNNNSKKSSCLGSIWNFEALSSFNKVWTLAYSSALVKLNKTVLTILGLILTISSPSSFRLSNVCEKFCLKRVFKTYSISSLPNLVLICYRISLSSGKYLSFDMFSASLTSEVSSLVYLIWLISNQFTSEAFGFVYCLDCYVPAVPASCCSCWPFFLNIFFSFGRSASSGLCLCLLRYYFS